VLGDSVLFVAHPWSDATSDEAIAGALLMARRERRTVAPMSTSFALSMERAYRIQQCGAELRRSVGERVIGWKLGYTSAAMREQMGIAEPNFAPLFHTMVVRDGDDVSDRFRQPKVEPEIAVVIGRDIDNPRQVRGSIVAAYACLEIVDSVFTDYRFTLADNTADGSSAAGVVCGLDIRALNLASVRVEMSRNGVVIGKARGSAASGDPLAGVEWLVTQLAARNQKLRTGDFVITGGLTAACDLLAGHQIEARFMSAEDDSSVSVSRS
jgi:2-keto-4-pentenoate hydratase